MSGNGHGDQGSGGGASDLRTSTNLGDRVVVAGGGGGTGGWIGGAPPWEDLINEEAEAFAAEVIEGILDGSPAIDDAPCVVEGATLGARHDAT